MQVQNQFILLGLMLRKKAANEANSQDRVGQTITLSTLVWSIYICSYKILIHSEQTWCLAIMLQYEVIQLHLWIEFSTLERVVC